MKIMFKQTKRNAIRILLSTLNSLLFTFYFFLFALSCQSAPKTAEAILPDAEFFPLDPGALAYSFVDIRDARPILNYVDFMGMSDKDFQQILDRSQTAIIAVYPPNHERRFQLTAWGGFPASGASMAFGASKSWKKMSSPTKAVYWYSATGQISVALTSRQAFVLAVRGNDSEENPVDPFPVKDTAVPEGFNEFRREAIFSCWINDPGLYIQQKLGEMGIPLAIAIEHLFVSLSPIPAQTSDGQTLYEALLKIQVPNAAQARAVATLFGIAQRNALPPVISGSNGAGDSSAALKYLLLSNPPTQDGKSIFFKTNALSAQEIALLFSLFSL